MEKQINDSIEGFSTKEYQKHIENEKSHFNPNIYRQNLSEKTSPALEYFLQTFQKKLKNKTGFTLGEHLINEVNKKNDLTQPVKILSIGSGPGGTEINLAKKFQVNYILDCVDINEKSLKMGQQRANSENLKINFIQQDINKIQVSSENYDIVFAHASLHHMINHEHIADEIKNGLKHDGVYIVQDQIQRNGGRMWEETAKVANEIWSIIPLKYKYDCVDQKHKEQFIDRLPDIDHSLNGFECIRSQDVAKVLKKKFRVKEEVQGFSFARRFFDKRFGGNYDLNNPYDKSLIDLIIRLDEECSLTHNLKPENVFLKLFK